MLILNSSAQLFDEGLCALGAGIKQLMSLTNLTLKFEYFTKNYFVEITKIFRNSCDFLAELAEFFFTMIILNSYTQVSDQGLSALGVGIKELRSLTNLALDLRYL